MANDDDGPRISVDWNRILLGLALLGGGYGAVNSTDRFYGADGRILEAKIRSAEARSEERHEVQAQLIRDLRGRLDSHLGSHPDKVGEFERRITRLEVEYQQLVGD